MTGKIKRRSLRCGGRPKADFGSLFTSVIAPAFNAAGSIADESIDNNKTITNGIVNNNTTIPSDPTKTPTMRLGGRKKCWIGAAIGAATSIAGSLFGNSAQKREMRRQQSIRDWQDATQEAANMTSVLNNSRDYQEDYLRQFRTAARLGKTLGAKGIYITDGGDATKIGNNTYLLRGGSHEDVNETGQTGIGINVGDNEVEAEGGEVAQKKNGALRIFSAQPILGNGMSPAQAILRGYNKDSVFSQQQAFKKRNGLKDDGSAKYGFGLLGETNAGNTAPMSEDPNTKGYSNKVVRNNSGRYVSYIRPTELVNHHQFWLGPTSNLINHLIRNGKVKDNIFESGSNAINYLPTDASYIEGDKKTYNEVNNALRYIKKDTGNPNPFINALDYFKTGKYHIDKNYNNKVKERGRDFMTDKNVINRINYLRKRHTLGSRPKALDGMYIPFNKRYTSIYDAPDYNSDYNGGNVLGNGEVTVTAKRIKPTFMKPNNDAMNIINHPANETPYIPQRHNRSRTIFSGGDYLGLGIDTLAALSTGLVNYNTAGKYTLPDRAPIIQASKLPTTYNVNPEIEEVKRYRDRLTGQTFNNTSSSVAALNRSSAINLDALSNLSKLWATKENEENKMLTEDAKNQQTIAAQNAQNELARQSEIARIKNEAIQAKGDALNVGLSGLSQAWTNFWTAGRTAYEDDQARRAMIASSKEATPTRLSEMDFDLSPDILASLYRTAKDDRTKRFYLSRLSPKQRQKYGIN